MIELTRITGEKLFINPAHLIAVQVLPDGVMVATSNFTYSVVEDERTVLKRVDSCLKESMGVTACFSDELLQDLDNTIIANGDN